MKKKPLNVILASREDENTWHDNVGKCDTFEEALKLVADKVKKSERPVDKVVIEIVDGEHRLVKGKLQAK